MSHYTVMVITSDGDYEKAFKNIIKNLNPDDYIAIVDCHI